MYVYVICMYVCRQRERERVLSNLHGVSVFPVVHKVLSGFREL